MDGLDSMTTEELEAEIERRKEVFEILSIPKMLRTFDRDCAGHQKYLLDSCEEYIAEIFKIGTPNENLEHNIFEGAVTWAYGPDIWTWIRERTNCRR